MFEYVIVCNKINAVPYIPSKEYQIQHSTHEFDIIGTFDKESDIFFKISVINKQHYNSLSLR